MKMIISGSIRIKKILLYMDIIWKTINDSYLFLGNILDALDS